MKQTLFEVEIKLETVKLPKLMQNKSNRIKPKRIENLQNEFEIFKIFCHFLTFSNSRQEPLLLANQLDLMVCSGKEL
jgi:hypothetical protein